MSDTNPAIQIIEALRRGLPPQRGIAQYAVGQEQLLADIERFHLSGISNRGVIRFISGSWGAGKTHFFRLLREGAFKNNCLVAGVELNVNEAPLNKFEMVFYMIVRNISTPIAFAADTPQAAAPFADVLNEALVFLSSGKQGKSGCVVQEDLARAKETLAGCPEIDVDFKKIVCAFWDTYLPDAGDPSACRHRREELLQWFSGEGTIASWRKGLGVNKVVSRENARIILKSLAAFVRLAGYQGLVILFDEAEMSHSVMSKSALKQAHNNLLHLLNNVSEISGLFLVYATTPDFYNDPKHGIVAYGALHSRIGNPPSTPPKALDNVWNLDAVEFTAGQYGSAAMRILAIYRCAYPDALPTLPRDDEVPKLVEDLQKEHPPLAPLKFWRVLTTGIVRIFDARARGEARAISDIHAEIMDEVRES